MPTQFYQLPNCNLFTQHMLCLESYLQCRQLEPRSILIIIAFPPTTHQLFSDAITVVLLSLLLSYYCCYHITPVTSAFPGVAELTTQLLRLISILWLPLCRINKFGFYFPRRLLRSPILVGPQDYFLAPLPGSIALLISSPGEYTLPISLFLFCFVLSSFIVLSLFMFSCVLFSLLLFSLFYPSLLLSILFLFSFVFRIYPKIHKNLKNRKSKKKLVLWIISMKLEIDLVGKAGPRRLNKNII